MMRESTNESGRMTAPEPLQGRGGRFWDGTWTC